MISRRRFLSIGVGAIGLLTGCSSQSNNTGVQNQQQQKACTDAQVEEVDWDYTWVPGDKDTVVTTVTNYADVGGEITMVIKVWGQKDYEELLDSEPRTRYIGAQETETYELKFYPTEGIESITIGVTQQACTYK